MNTIYLSISNMKHLLAALLVFFVFLAYVAHREGWQW